MEENHRTIKEAVFEVLKNPETIGSPDLPDDNDESYWNEPKETEETDAERNNRKLHEALIAAAMASVPRTKGRVQAQFTKKRHKKLTSKERRKRSKQSRKSK